MAKIKGAGPGQDPAPPQFEVQIHRGNRAAPGYEGSAPRPPRANEAVALPAAAANPARRRLQLLLGGAIVLAVLAALTAYLFSQPPPGAVARVNGEYILMARIDKEVLVNRALSALSSSSVAQPATRAAILDRLISERLQAQDAERAGVTVSDTDLDSVISNLAQQQGWTIAGLDEALQRQGLARVDLRASVHDSVLIERYVRDVVVKGARDGQSAQALQTAWSTALFKAARIDRLRDPEAAAAPKAGANAPDFTLQGFDGRQYSLSALRGRPVLLNFWAPWCQPCRGEMPILSRMYRAAQAASPSGQGLELLAVAVDSSPDAVRAFQKELDLPFPVMLDSNSEVLNLYRLGPIPTSFLIDRGGVVRWVQIGPSSDALLEDKLQLAP